MNPIQIEILNFPKMGSVVYSLSSSFIQLIYRQVTPPSAILISVAEPLRKKRPPFFYLSVCFFFLEGYNKIRWDKSAIRGMHTTNLMNKLKSHPGTLCFPVSHISPRNFQSIGGEFIPAMMARKMGARFIGILSHLIFFFSIR